MKTVRAFGLAAVIGLLLVVAPAASAGIFTIDHFTDPTGGQTITATTGTVTGTAGPALANCVGGYRTMAVTINANPFTQTGQLQTANVSGGVVSFSTGSGVSATGVVTWDNNGLGLAGVNIVPGGVNPYLQAKMLFSDVNLGFRFDVWDTSARHTYWSTNLGAGVAFVNQALSSFSGDTGTIDYTMVDKMQLTLTGPVSQDGTIDLLEITNTPTPEPATMAFLALGGLGLAAIRRRRSA